MLLPRSVTLKGPNRARPSMNGSGKAIERSSSQWKPASPIGEGNSARTRRLARSIAEGNSARKRSGSIVCVWYCTDIGRSGPAMGGETARFRMPSFHDRGPRVVVGAAFLSCLVNLPYALRYRRFCFRFDFAGAAGLVLSINLIHFGTEFCFRFDFGPVNLVGCSTTVNWCEGVPVSLNNESIGYFPPVITGTDLYGCVCVCVS